MVARKYGLYALASVGALVIGIGVARMFYAPDTRQSHAPEQLWALHLPDQYGKSQAMAQWRDKVLVLNFWATWCAPCREEIPDFIAVRSRYLAKNVEIVGIAIDAATPVAAYAQKMRMPYPVLIGEGGALTLARALGNSSGALPYSVVINADGKIILRHLGRLPRAKLEAILAQNTSSAKLH